MEESKIVSGVRAAKDLMEGVDYFLQDGEWDWRSCHKNPAELLLTQTSAQEWLETNALKFDRMKEQLLNGPEDCFYQTVINGVHYLNDPILTWTDVYGHIDEDSCVSHFGWTKEDCRFFQKGLYYLSILEEDAPYRTVEKVAKGVQNLVDGYASKIERIEIERQNVLEEKWRKK